MPDWKDTLDLRRQGNVAGFVGANTPLTATTGSLQATGLLADLGVVGDGITHNAAIINSALAADAGDWHLPPGPLLLEACLHIPKNTVLHGWTMTTSAALDGSSVPHGLVFDSTTIMPGTNAFDVVADGTRWTFTKHDGLAHGLNPGDSYTGSGFATAGFNIACLIASVTPTTFTVTNTTVPAASDSGLVNVHLIRVGPWGAVGPNSRLETVWVEARRIPGSIGVYSNSVQESGGLEKVTVHNAMYRSVVVDSGDPAGTGIRALNYLLRDVRTIGSATADSTYRGLQIIGANVSVRGVDNLTCVMDSGNAAPAAQVKIDGCRGSLRNIHVEGCTDGIMVGEDVGCQGMVITGVTGNATCTTAVRVPVPASGTNTLLTFFDVFANGSTNTLVDSVMNITYTGAAAPVVGRHATDGAIAANMGSDTAIATSTTSLVSTASLPVGRHEIKATVTALGGAGTTGVGITVTAGTATMSVIGQKSATIQIAGAEEGSATVCFVALVSVAGTVTLKARAAGAAATAKAASGIDATYTNATGIVATKVA